MTDKKYFSLFFGCLFWVMGASGLLLLSKVTTLSCERVEFSNQGNCELVQRGILGSKTRTLPLQALQKAEVMQSVSQDEGRTYYTYRLVFHTPQGELPFTSYWSSEQQIKEQQAAQVNAYLQEVNQPTLVIRQDDRRLALVLGGFWGVVGAIAIFEGLPWVKTESD